MKQEIQELDPGAAQAFAEKIWESEVVPKLVDYIRIPNKSPMFDADWMAHGHMARAVDLIEGWCRERKIPGLTVERIELPGRTPLIFMDIPAARGGPADDTVLLYGHLDKQPEMVGWREGLGPWKPVREGDRLYGRGGADDGYAAFASLLAIETLLRQELPHARCVVLIEACEESGSPDLPPYIEHLGDRIGQPSLVVCLDSGCGDYERLWHTTSLRGLVVGELQVEILTEGVHSGDAGGVVPESFRLARSILSRLEDETTGQILPAALHVDIPAERVRQAKEAAAVLSDAVFAKFPFVPGARPGSEDAAELVLNRTWRPALAVTGAGGLPALADAGNVLRPVTSLKLSLRLPPNLEGGRAAGIVKEILEADPPQGARVSFLAGDGATGWEAPPLAPWLAEAVDAASRAFFGPPSAQMGEGGTIPFMAMLGERFPEAQFLITGVLGPASNAHGPNEFLHLPTAKRLTGAVAEVLRRHALRTA